MKKDRDLLFQHLVLGALWVLILAAFGRKDSRAATNFQCGAIGFGDMYGQQTEEAKKYRREVTYPYLH